MVRLPRHVRALVAAVGALAVCGGLAATSAPASVAAPAEPTSTTGIAARTAVSAAVDDAPLRVRIGTMTPSALPADAPIRITGTVTNTTDETWSTIRLYAFMGDSEAPMRTRAQVDAALDVPFDDVVGERVVTDTGFGEVDELLPGASASYRIRVPVSELEVTRPGVYWFGVHALGISDSVPDDLTADGRARTFLPYVPPRIDVPVPTALVVPLTRQVEFAADGSVADPDGWTEALGPEGELTRVLQLVDTTTAPVTWLVDPALLDAVGQLADGNRPRSLGPTPSPDSPTGPPDDDATGDPETADPSEAPELSPSARTATEWLAALDASLAGDQVLALPYGNIDVPATIAHDPRLYELALAQDSSVLQQLDVDPTPALAPPSGYLDADSLANVAPGTRVLVTDRMFGADPPSVAQIGGQPVVVTSYGATEGSPGPGPGVTTVGLRQRLLAEAAVRSVRSGPEPLIVVLPTDTGFGAGGFFSGLDVPWLSLENVDDATSPGLLVPTSAADLDYPVRQRQRELDSTTVASVADLVDAGDTLQSLLTDNTEVGGVVAEEALTGLSYPVRDDQVAGRAASAASRQWLQDQLDGVRVDAARGVTLSSARGDFSVVVTNDLPYAVSVRVRADTDAGMRVSTSDEISLAPGSRTNVLLTARATDNRVHNVRVLLTDVDGVPIGSSDEVPIRSALVSDVIWLIMGTGAGLLFLAIAVRLVRRIRAARRGDTDDPGGPENPGGPGSAEAPQPVEAL